MLYYKKAAEILQTSGFVGGSVYPCFFVKKSVKDVVCIALYADNNLMTGDMAAIDNVIEALKNKGLVLKIVEGLQDYLSCNINFPIIKRGLV